jgi:hypothetical protein
VMLESTQERSGSELVFGVLRTLMMGYRVWGSNSGVEVTQLCGLMRTNQMRLARALTYLVSEGLVSMDEPTGTVRLSADGAWHLLAERQDARIARPDAPSERVVVFPPTKWH